MALTNSSYSCYHFVAKLLRRNPAAPSSCASDEQPESDSEDSDGSLDMLLKQSDPAFFLKVKKAKERSASLQPARKPAKSKRTVSKSTHSTASGSKSKPPLATNQNPDANAGSTPIATNTPNGRLRKQLDDATNDIKLVTKLVPILL